MDDFVADPHIYLSTGCLHGEHEYCRNMTGQQGDKRPGRCKFCEARCVCPCHLTAGDLPGVVHHPGEQQEPADRQPEPDFDGGPQG